MARISTGNRRTEATRARLINSFVALAMTHGFENVSMDRIATAAGVGRSTAYNHYRGTRQLLEATLARPCTALAASVRLRAVPELVPLLRHFQEQWRRNPSFFREPIWSLFAQCLARMIATALRLDPDRNRHQPSVPHGMLAPMLAELQLGIVRRWLDEHSAVRPETVAKALTASVHRLVFGERI